MIVRLEGHNATIGNQRLEESGLNIIACEGFAQAAASAVKLSKGEK